MNKAVKTLRIGIAVTIGSAMLLKSKKLRKILSIKQNYEDLNDILLNAADKLIKGGISS